MDDGGGGFAMDDGGGHTLEAGRGCLAWDGGSRLAVDDRRGHLMVTVTVMAGRRALDIRGNEWSSEGEGQSDNAGVSML